MQARLFSSVRAYRTACHMVSAQKSMTTRGVPLLWSLTTPLPSVSMFPTRVSRQDGEMPERNDYKSYPRDQGIKRRSQTRLYAPSIFIPITAAKKQNLHFNISGRWLISVDARAIRRRGRRPEAILPDLLETNLSSLSSSQRHETGAAGVSHRELGSSSVCVHQRAHQEEARHCHWRPERGAS